MAYPPGVKCAACQHENPAGSKFCESCGAAARAEGCSRCGAALSTAARFCNQCGAAQNESAAPDRGAPREYTPRHLAERILTTRAALEGERKQVTVLFADVKGSMGLAEVLDPERWHGILDRFFEILASGIHRFEGTVNQYTGDGVMALFGAPIAHEDHAQRACFAALHLQRELRSYADELRLEGLNLSVRIGLNSGDVVVGKIGDDLRMDYTAQGLTVGLAQRAEELAEAGRVLLTSHTARLVEGYLQLRSLGRPRLRGVSEPLELFELEGLGALRTRLDASRAAGFTRFVGRESELTQLEAALERAVAADSAVVGVVGEAGVGKSRLCQTFVEQARGRGIAVYEAHCPSHGRALSNVAALEMARSFFGVDDRDSPDEARRKVAGTLVLLDERFRESLPLLFDFLGFPDPDRPVEGLDANARRRQMVAFLRELVRARSEKQVAILLMDDLHWIDPESDAFLADQIAAAEGTRTLVLTNFRPEYDAEWMAGSRYQQIPLRPLGRAESAALLASLLGADPSLEPVRERVLERAGGNPFFCEELVKALADSGALEGVSGAYVLRGGADDLVMPESVQALLSARIDRLDEREKRVLQTAAVIGRDFTWGVLSRVAELPENDLTASLDALVRAELVFETELYPEPAYQFKHALTESVAYEEQLRERRRQVHAAVARALEEDQPEKIDERAAEIARHRDEAGEEREAALAYARAGDHAGIRFAEAAARYWTRVLELTEGASSDEMLALRLRACVSRLLRGWSATTGVEEARQILLDGRALAERLGDRAALMRLESAYALLLLGDDPKAQFPHLEKALELIDETTPLAERISLHQRYSWTHAWFGDARIALETAEAGLALDEGGASADPCLLGYNSVVALLATRVESVARLGRLDEARRDTPALLDVARRHADPLSGMLARHAAGLAEMLRGDLAEADPLLREGIETASELDLKWAAPTAGLLAEVRQYRGDLPGALEAARLAERIFQEDRGGIDTTRTSPGRARKAVLAWLVNPESETRAEAEEALSAAAEDETLAAWALAHATLARLLYGAEGRDQIESELQRAERDLAARGIVAMAPLVHAERAELASLLGDAAGGQRELGEAIRLAREMGATGWVERFERLRSSRSVDAER